MRVNIDEFKNVIALYFYDKELTVCEVSTIQHEDGQVQKEFVETENTLIGNVRFNDLARVQEDYGIKENIDVAITTNDTIENGTILKYETRFFEIIKVIPFDTHNLLIGKQWLLESQTLISA
jgi:hypothetical protein